MLNSSFCRRTLDITGDGRLIDHASKYRKPSSRACRGSGFGSGYRFGQSLATGTGFGQSKPGTPRYQMLADRATFQPTNRTTDSHEWTQIQVSVNHICVDPWSSVVTIDRAPVRLCSTNKATDLVKVSVTQCNVADNVKRGKPLRFVHLMRA